MQYLMMIYTDEIAESKLPREELTAIYARYKAFTDEVVEKKMRVGGNALHPTSTATTVRVRDGRMTTTDGPFAETKEQLGGFYLLECRNLDEAIEYAARIPSAETGSIEIRPIMVLS